MHGDDRHTFVRRDGARGTALIREEFADVPLEQFWADGEALDGVQGRAGVRVLEIEGRRVVARDYRRGGVFGRLLGDRHFEPGRAERELVVLDGLRRHGVPVVRAVGAFSRRAGVAHRLRLLTELVDDAQPVPAFVREHPALRRAVVREAGRVVDAAFRAGLRHPDLHPDNLIARIADDRVTVWMLDLDRASLREGATRAQRQRAEAAMLLRMTRYLYRHAARLHASRTDQLRFLVGLGLDRSRRRELWRTLAPRLAKALARRGLTTSRSAIDRADTRAPDRDTPS